MSWPTLLRLPSPYACLTSLRIWLNECSDKRPYTGQNRSEETLPGDIAVIQERMKCFTSMESFEDGLYRCCRRGNSAGVSGFPYSPPSAWVQRIQLCAAIVPVIYSDVLT